jgi:hypothetical protein
LSSGQQITTATADLAARQFLRQHQHSPSHL